MMVPILYHCVYEVLRKEGQWIKHPFLKCFIRLSQEDHPF